MRLLISGGGTGGHIYPALALIEAVKQKEPDSTFLYVGSKRGLENEIVPKAGIDFVDLEIQGFSRSLSLTNFKTISLFNKSVKESKEIIREFKPDIVVGTGGYVSGAVLYAAQRLRIPTVIHEQNSVAGITNKFLSRGATKIAVTFKSVESSFPNEKVVFTGNPRAQQIAHLKSKLSLKKEFNLEDKKSTLLIFGGSQGAPAINLAVIDIIKRLNERDYQVIFVTGESRYQSVLDVLKKMNIKVGSNIAIVPYIDKMDQLLSKIDAIVARAGATTLAEITAIGVPSILIPSPNVTADHQTKNAQSLVDGGAAILLTEEKLNPATLIHSIDQIMTNKQTQKEMSKDAQVLGVTDAADRLYQVLKESIENDR